MLFRIDNRTIYFDILGPPQAEVVCFVHSLATDSGMWAEQVPALLTAGYRVFRMDIRGHGGSDPVAGDYTMYDLADDVAATLRYVEIEKVHLVGLSIGGMIGQAFVDRYPAMLYSLVLCDTQPASSPDAQAMWGPRMETVKAAGSLKPIAEGMAERWLSAEFKSNNRLRWTIVYDTIVLTDIVGWRGCAMAIQNFDFTKTLRNVTVPTLSICGAEDPATPPEENRRIADIIPHGKYVEIPEAKHLPNIEKPHAFNEILLNWLQSVD